MLLYHLLSVFALDDCNWGDHVGQLHREFGVIGVRTPQGLRLVDFEHGLKTFQAAKN